MVLKAPADQVAMCPVYAYSAVETRHVPLLRDAVRDAFQGRFGRELRHDELGRLPNG
jgi:hypothetical protein